MMYKLVVTIGRDVVAVSGSRRRDSVLLQQ
jgi:hypothetical protein